MTTSQPRLTPEEREHAASDCYANNTCKLSNGGRSLYPEHFALYQQELAEERGEHIDTDLC